MINDPYRLVALSIQSEFQFHLRHGHSRGSGPPPVGRIQRAHLDTRFGGCDV